MTGLINSTEAVLKWTVWTSEVGATNFGSVGIYEIVLVWLLGKNESTGASPQQIFQQNVLHLDFFWRKILFWCSQFEFEFSCIGSFYLRFWGLVVSTFCYKWERTTGIKYELNFHIQFIELWNTCWTGEDWLEFLSAFNPETPNLHDFEWAFSPCSLTWLRTIFRMIYFWISNSCSRSSLLRKWNCIYHWS